MPIDLQSPLIADRSFDAITAESAAFIESTPSLPCPAISCRVPPPRGESQGALE